MVIIGGVYLLYQITKKLKIMTTNYRTCQTHPNRGSITILFPNSNNVAYGPFSFYVNSQVAPGIASSQPIKYSSEGLEAETLQELANKLALNKGDKEGI